MDDLEFDRHKMKEDEFGKIPALKLDDLQLRDDTLPVKLSMIIAFSSWRREQLARSLETIARQTFREFEVLICDMGSGQKMEGVYKLFRPYIRLKTAYLPRTTWSSCPTKGIKAMLPMAEGDVIGIMQPEMMLNPNAFWYLYWGNYREDLPNDLRFTHTATENVVMRPEQITSTDGGGGETFVNLRNYFLSPSQVHNLDGIDWHANVDNMRDMFEFWDHKFGLSGMTNRQHWEKEEHRKWIWWFIGSAKRSATLWEDLPSFDGHASIDFFLIGYKQIMGYTEVIPQIPLAYHQEHMRASFAPERELWVQTPSELVKYLKNIGRIE
jgi:hypothetical protein